MSAWYNKLYKEAAKGFGDYVYETYLAEKINLSISSYRKNVSGPMAAGGRFQKAIPEHHSKILEQAQKVKGARDDVTAHVKFKYGKMFKEEYQKLELRSKDKQEFRNGLKNIRTMYPVPEKLIERFVEEYKALDNIEFETESQVVDTQQVYEDLIAPEFFKRREKGEIVFVYTKASFKAIFARYDAIKFPFFKLRDSIKIKKYRVDGADKKQIVSYDEDALNQVIDGLIRVNELKLGELQSQSLYEVAESTKAVRSFHEFAIRDILAICGINFDIEVPFEIVGSKVYKGKAVVDFLLPGQEFFEVFGDMRGNYDERKQEKIDKLPNLWYVDYAKGLTATPMESRTITMYCNSLNSDCYSNKSPDSGPGSLQGKDYLATVIARVPLLDMGHIAKLDLYWQWAMNLPADVLRSLRDKVKEIQRDPALQPLPMTTAQYNIEDYRISLPNLNEIYASLASGKVADGATPFEFPDGGGFSQEFIKSISGHELIALYFQTPENIMPYLEQISSQIDSYQAPSQESPSQESYPFVQPDYSDPSLLDSDEEPMARAASSRRAVKTSSIEIDEKEFNNQIKDLICKDSFFDRLFGLYEVPLEAVKDSLNFYIVDLDGRHAKSKGNDIYINYKLLKNNNKLDDILHFVVHEMIHWLTRQREKMCYFSDPEELEAFALGIAFELRRGQDEEKIREIYFPIIEAHFKENGQAEKMFAEFMKSAHLLNKNIFL